jgi:vitamin B12 transporter
MFNRIRVGAVMLASLSPAVFAATTTDPIVVTATRTSRTVDETLAPVTVITREDIETRQIRSVQDLLRGGAGVGLGNAGGPGKATNLFLRGTESDHVLVLIDGVKVGSASLGLTPFQDLPIEQIERVEIVRGPRSHLYGSEAIGGVIQIFTRRGGGDLTPSASIGGGTYGTRTASAGLSGGGENAWFNIGLSDESTDGFDACRGEPNVAGCFTVEPDDDGYENTSGSFRAGYRFKGGAEIDLRYLDSDNETEFDGAFQNETETGQEVLGAGLRASFGEDTLFKLDLGRSKDLSTNFTDGAFASRFDTDRDSASLQVDRFVGDRHILTAGVDYIDDHVDSDLDFVETERDNVGLFAQYQGSFGPSELQVALRRDDNEQFGGETTGGVTLARRLSSGQRVTAAYATAFKAPSFNELYFPGFGNPDLDPESAENFELGLAGAGGAWAVNLYHTNIDDLIGVDPDTFAPINVDAARIRGIEFVLNKTIAKWRTSAALTLLDPENRAAAFRGNQLPRRAEQTFRIDLDRDFERFSVGATLVAEGRKFDDLSNTRVIDSYATVDLRGSMIIARHWTVQLRVENLFDEDYETASFFNQPGRGAYLTVRYRPQP